MAETKILTCYCDHEYQNEKYGNKKRVHNKMAKERQYRCTVCGNEKVV